jgi:RNA polymerase sigma-70 factor (ECF subfamily)
MRELTFSELAQAEDALPTEAAMQMDEASFRAFYNRTAHGLWAYLAKATGDSAAADDLMQESYYRFLRARPVAMNEERAKQYLFRTATNLLRDRWRRGQGKANVTLDDVAEVPAAEQTAESVQARSDMSAALCQLKPRELQLLWLAYVEGSSHKEISDVVGLRTVSVRPMLFRARQKLLGILRKAGITGGR